MREKPRPRHQRVMTLLDSLDDEILERNACFFGGGTRIVLELDEYRESLDVDFLCADQAEGLGIAKTAYGDSVTTALESVLDLFAEGYRGQCLTELEVRSRGKLNAGLSQLRALVE